MVLTLGLLHKPIEKDWTPFICSVSDVSYTLLGMTVLRRTGLIEVSLDYIKYANEDTLPDSHTLYQPTRFFESASK